MSMSTHVAGFRPADDKWNQMKEVWNTCEKAGVNIPAEVMKFFEHENPNDKAGIEVEIESAITKYSSSGCAGFDVDITKLPKDVKIVRFYNSW